MLSVSDIEQQIKQMQLTVYIMFTEGVKSSKKTANNQYCEIWNRYGNKLYIQLAFSSKTIPEELRKKTDWFVYFCNKGNTDPEWQWRTPFTTSKYSFDEVS